MWIQLGDGVRATPIRTVEATTCVDCGSIVIKERWESHVEHHNDLASRKHLNKLIDDYNGLMEAMKSDLSHPRHRNA